MALLKRAGDGGNYELAVTAPVEQTLFPGGQVIDPADVPAPVADEAEASLESDSQNVQVLSALSKDRQLTVQLSRLAPDASRCRTVITGRRSGRLAPPRYRPGRRKDNNVRHPRARRFPGSCRHC